VQVIGRNGQPVFGQNTDSEGHARLPSLRDLRQEKAPSMFLVTLGRDTSFLPYGRQDRLLDMSRFDVGGVTDSESNQGTVGLSLFRARSVPSGRRDPRGRAGAQPRPQPGPGGAAA
jgi:uncharacterized protein YfaS (alpha-2-macroglobulin family)